MVQESQAETVRKIFAWYADGINGTEIAQTLTQEGAPNKSGMPQWSARQVLSITKNTIYTQRADRECWEAAAFSS